MVIVLLNSLLTLRDQRGPHERRIEHLLYCYRQSNLNPFKQNRKHSKKFQVCLINEEMGWKLRCRDRKFFSYHIIALVLRKSKISRHDFVKNFIWNGAVKPSPSFEIRDSGIRRYLTVDNNGVATQHEIDEPTAYPSLKFDEWFCCVKFSRLHHEVLIIIWNYQHEIIKSEQSMSRCLSNVFRI